MTPLTIDHEEVPQDTCGDEEPEPQDRSQSTLTWALQPVCEEHEVASLKHWLTDCGRYRISQVRSRVQARVRYAACHLTSSGGWDAVEINYTARGYGTIYYATPKEAEQAIRDFHGRHCKYPDVHSNRDDLLDAIAGKPVTAQAPPQEVPAATTGTTVRQSSLRRLSADEQQRHEQAKAALSLRKRTPAAAILPHKTRLYLAWKAGQVPSTAEAVRMMTGRVPASTVRSWLSAWPQGRNIPPIPNPGDDHE